MLDLDARLRRVRGRLDRKLLLRIVQASLAAGAAWELARRAAGHSQPFFAPIAALIGLMAQPGTRGLQAWRMLVGVAVGIALGAAVVSTVGVGSWQLVVVVAVALLVTTAAGATPLTVVQAAASGILVVALHRPGTNLAAQRIVDAAIGGGIAIVVAQLLFPIDPVRLVRRESQRLRDELAAALDDVAAALDGRDRSHAEAALARIDGIDERRLHEALRLARDVARRAPRRRAARRRLDPLDELVHGLDAAVADARAIVTGALRLLGSESEPPRESAVAVRALAAALRPLEPDAVRTATAEALAAARSARAQDASLGTGVLAHAVASVAADIERVAAAREEQRRQLAYPRGRLRR